MHNSSQSVQQRGTLYTQLSLSMHPNTNNNRSIIQRQGLNRKSSYLQFSQSTNYMSIIQKANLQLQQYLFNLNEHIKKVIEKRQTNYIMAFENHVASVEKELKNIKKNYQESKMYEKTISLEQVICRMEKQCSIFRQQAMRYFQLLEQKEEELKNTKRQSEMLRKQLEISQFAKKKLLQKLKIDSAQDQFEINQTNNQFFQEFLSNKAKSKTEKAIIIRNDNKFRKTLLEFNMKNSSQYFKQVTTSRRDTRSFLTNSSIRDIRKNQATNRNENIVTEISEKIVTQKPQNANSLSKMNNYLTIRVDEQKVEDKYKECNCSPFELQLVRNSLERILKNKFIEMKVKSKQVLEDCQFNFNSEQGINNFLQCLFNSEIRIESQPNISIPLQFDNERQTKFPFERITLTQEKQKTQRNLVGNSIYSVERASNSKSEISQRSDKKIITIPIRPSGMSKKSISSKWMDLKINKNKNDKKSKIEKNLSFHLIRQTQYDQ